MNLKRADNADQQPAMQNYPADTPRRTRLRLSAHPLFAPMLAIWGAVIGAVCILVLPDAGIAAFTAVIAPDIDPSLGRLIAAAIVAFVIGSLCFGIARAFGRYARRLHPNTSLAAMAMRHVRPIDPTNELGSVSFDAPLENEAHPPLKGFGGGAHEQRNDVLDFTDDEPCGLPINFNLHRHETTDSDVCRVADDDANIAPRALDLSEFAQLPGRNAVWVEEPLEPFAAPDTDAPSAPAAALTAIAKLRAVPPGELSLVQMVERFAVALQDYQAAKDAQVPAFPESARNDSGNAERDAVLGEALRALHKITERGQAETGRAKTGQARSENRLMRGAA